MRGDLDVLLVHDSVELTGRHDPRLERELIHLRTWCSRVPLHMSRRQGFVQQIPDDALKLDRRPDEIETDLTGAKRFRDQMTRGGR